MGVTASNEFITTEELNALAEIALAPKVMNEGEVQLLDRIEYPTLNVARRKAPKEEQQSVLGAYRYEVAGNRAQRINWYDGAQKLKFEGHFTPFHLDFPVGKGHFGDLMVIDVVERAGIKVRYSEELREGGVPRERQHVIINILKQNRVDIENAIEFDMCRRFWEANADAPKCFAGVDSLFPRTSNSTGTVGGASRSLPVLRHQLITGVTSDTVESSFSQMERLCADANGGNGSMIDHIACGDNFFDLLNGLYKGTSTTAGKYTIQVGYDQAAKMADKFKIGLPVDAFVGPNGALITREPMFRKLDALTNPATLWANSMFFFNFSHLFFLTEKHNEQINHGMPYDQRVNYSSTHMAHALATRAPAAHGVMVKT